MVARISQKISLALLKGNAINQEELNVYTYGIQLLILTVFDWCITFFIMILLGKVWLSLIYFAVFISLRHHCGGYHAKTHLRCVLASNTVYVLSVGFALFLTERNSTAGFVLGEIINFIILFYFAPTEHKNKPISEKELKKHKCIGRVLNMFLSCIAFMFMFIGARQYAWIVLLGQLSVSIAIMLEKGKKDKTLNKKGGKCK